jgi:hypothetical protein
VDGAAFCLPVSKGVFQYCQKHVILLMNSSNIFTVKEKVDENAFIAHCKISFSKYGTHMCGCALCAPRLGRKFRGRAAYDKKKRSCGQGGTAPPSIKATYSA